MNNRDSILSEKETLAAPKAAVSGVNLTSQILNKIETGAVKPRARWMYLTEEYTLWILWAVTVLFGALSVAVTFFVFSHQRFALYELTHQDFITFAVEVLPTLWLALFAVMVVFGVFNMRHTKRGYRYPLWQILGSSVVVSLALGAVLHLAGAGFSLDKKLGTWAKGYSSQEKLELKWWQNPDEGRLVGAAFHVRESGSTDIRFVDVAGTAWQLDVSELHEEEERLLLTGGQVRLFGTGEVGTIFHACGAMPWVQDRNYRGEELAQIRQGARSKIDGFKAEKIAMMASSTICGEFMRGLQKPPQMGW